MFVAVLCLTRPTAAQQPAVWRADVGDDAKHLALTLTGAVLIQTNAGITAYAADSGTQLWSRPDASEYSVIGGTPLAIVRVGEGRRVIDLTTGKDRWDFAKLGLSEPVRFVGLPARGSLLVYGPGGTSRLTMLEVGLDSGVVRWRQDTLLASEMRDKTVEIAKHVSPTMVGDSAILLDADDGGLLDVRLADGAVLWRLPRSEIRLDKVTAPLRIVDRTLYIGRERTLFAVDPATGKVRWKSQRDFPGDVRRVDSSAAGVVAGGYFMHVGWSNEPRVFLDVLDPTTGSSRWPKAFEVHGWSPFLVRNDSIFQPVHKGFRVLEAASGKSLVEAETPEFKANEEPLLIEPLENGDFVLGAQQNLMGVDATGRPKYHRYLKAPGASMLAKVAAITATVAISALGAANAGSTGGVYFVPTGLAASPFATRYHATVNANRYAYIYTGEVLEGDGFDLVRFDKRDGTEKGRVRLTERSPVFVFEPVTATVITLVGHELVAYRYPTP
jgi:outer membrane protein assembly factor BamB